MVDLDGGGLGGPPARPGTVHIVGAGPGDPGCLTLRAATLLATCDVVAYDRLAPLDALELVPEHADRICVGRRASDPGRPRHEVDELLRTRAAAGQAVVRLKGGDPFVFGRGGEEADACVTAGIPFEVVPGITSPVAAPGAAGIPVTHRDVAAGFAVVTGHERAGKGSPQVDHAALAGFTGTLVVLMGLERLPEVAGALIRHGRDPDTPAAVVAAATTPTQSSVTATLATIADAATRAEIPPPAVVVVGDVVGLAERLAGREQRPLHAMRVLLPRLGDDAARLAPHLRHAGAQVLQARLGRDEPADPAAMARLVVDVLERRVTTLLVSSAPGARQLADTLGELDADARSLAGLEIVAVGRRARARLRTALGVTADETVADVADHAVTAADDGIAALVGEDDLLDHHCRERGIRRVVRRVVASPPRDLPEVDAVVVAASRLAGPVLAAVPAHVPLVSLGPRTTRRLRALGRAPDVEAATATPTDLIGALAGLRAATSGAPPAAVGDEGRS